MDQLDDVFAIYYDAVHSGTDCPKNIPTALAGLDAALWRTALTSEWRQHEKNGTFGPPIDPKDLPPGVRPIPFVYRLRPQDETRLHTQGARHHEGLPHD
jgi:hypothetical protein